MKKLILASLAAAALVMAVPSATAADNHKGGVVGGIIGCCFGLRAAADYNDGKDISVREWLRIVPFVNIVIAVLDTADGYRGVTRSQLHAETPTYF